MPKGGKSRPLYIKKTDKLATKSYKISPVLILISWHPITKIKVYSKFTKNGSPFFYNHLICFGKNLLIPPFCLYICWDFTNLIWDSEKMLFPAILYHQRHINYNSDLTLQPKRLNQICYCSSRQYWLCLRSSGQRCLERYFDTKASNFCHVSSIVCNILSTKDCLNSFPFTEKREKRIFDEFEGIWKHCVECLIDLPSRDWN